ncbi:MAG: D-glycero-alpha-D-manno-heptose-1,7-bisphosphate 7-phosphatase [Verrucomicrobiales bacterium]
MAKYEKVFLQFHHTKDFDFKAMTQNKAIFLDRDGTLIADKDYLHTPEEVSFFPGTADALRKAIDAGFSLVMVTNQSGVGRGYFTLADVENVHHFIISELGKSGVHFLKIYTAPEHPDKPSRGRKPSPAFLHDARDEFGIDLAQSFMIGDKLIDLECGWNAGVKRSILVKTGYGNKVAERESSNLKDAVVVDDICGAIEWILKNQE